MTSTKARSNTTFIMIPCRCGRLLRAKWDQVGTKIVCWDCQASTKVVIPRDQLRLVGQISRAVTEVFGQQDSTWIVGATAVLTLALLVPYAGLGLASLLMLCGAALYGDQFVPRENPEASSGPTWERIWRELTWGRSLACLLFTAGTVLPLWVFNAGYHRSPHLNRFSLPVLGLAWTVLPIVMAVVFSMTPATRTEHHWRFLRWHPLISVAILAIVPLSLVGCEAFVGGIVYLKEMLPLFAFDYMPIPGHPSTYNGILFYNQTSYIQLPTEDSVLTYLSGLRHGYSLVGSIPPSMSVPTDAELNPDAVRLPQGSFYWIRASLVFTINLVLILSFAVQARCLSVVVHAQRQRNG